MTWALASWLYLTLSTHCQLLAAACVHPGFLVDAIVRKKTQNLCYVQIVPLHINCIAANLHFQNKCCSKTDCATTSMKKLTSKHSYHRIQTWSKRQLTVG